MPSLTIPIGETIIDITFNVMVDNILCRKNVVVRHSLVEHCLKSVEIKRIYLRHYICKLKSLEQFLFLFVCSLDCTLYLLSEISTRILQSQELVYSQYIEVDFEFAQI